MFTKEQLNLIGEHFAASNTGLVGLHWPKPTTEQDIRSNYSQISYEYECNTGDGLYEEKQMWIKKFEDEENFNENLNWVEKEIPFVMK
jgi:hypothetical protein